MVIKEIKAFKEAYKQGVKHCTLDPEGPGVVRMHLIPPRFSPFRRSSFILILNGYYILPLGYSWAILLSHFIDCVNGFNKKELGVEAVESIACKAIRLTKRSFPNVSEEMLRDDLDSMLDIIFAVADGEVVEGIERLSIRAYGKSMSAPHRVDLAVSAMTDGEGRWKCNHKCRFCYAAGQELACTKELSTEEWMAAIDKLKAAGVPMLTFTGGEPTLREDLCKLIDYSRWFVTRLNTNGVLLTPELVKGLREASLDSLQITLYSANAEIHNALVGSDTFEKTVQGIRLAVECGLDVSINTPLCADNSDYLSTVKLARELGVRYLTVSGIILSGNAKNADKSGELDGAALYSAVAEAKRYCDENGMELDFTSPGLIDEEKLTALGMRIPSCGACLSNMAIAPDGTVIPCQSWMGSAWGLGNILTDTWKRIWNDKRCVKLRKMKQDEALRCPFRTGVLKK